MIDGGTTWQGQAQLNYRYALDAALALLGMGRPLAVCCDLPQLGHEIGWRVPQPVPLERAWAALWIEPLVANWRSVLGSITNALPTGALLAVITSQPLAGLLPERRPWRGQLVGLQPWGVSRLRQALRRAGFRHEAAYGIHSPQAIALGLLARQAVRWGRPDLCDRLRAAARLHYCTTGLLAPWATIGLLGLRKGDA